MRHIGEPRCLVRRAPALHARCHHCAGAVAAAAAQRLPGVGRVGSAPPRVPARARQSHSLATTCMADTPMSLLLLRAPGAGRELFALELRAAAAAANSNAGAELVEAASGVWHISPPVCDADAGAFAAAADARAGASAADCSTTTLQRRLLASGLAGLRSSLRVLLGPCASPGALLGEARRRGRRVRGRRAWLVHEQHYPATDASTFPFLRHEEAPMLLARLLSALGAEAAAAPAEADVELMLLQVRGVRPGVWHAAPAASADTTGRRGGEEWLLAEVSRPSTPAWIGSWRRRPHAELSLSLDAHHAAAAIKVTLLAHLERRPTDAGAVRVLDPCAGHGTLLAAAAAQPDVVHFYGGDVRGAVVQQSRANLRFAGVDDDRVTLLEHDATHAFPSRFCGASVVMANPPWGRNAGSEKRSDGTHILRSVLQQFPQATFGFFAHRESLEELRCEGALAVLKRVPIRRHVDFVVGVSGAEGGEKKKKKKKKKKKTG
eukprot:NODE_6165_length_1699_cov_4.182570.p1 GENE.NODE_6165_length_1699_cov_4.182570~~NODE_6165_length_1699_cov_4.182570.p1  ORF type:complete len:492 (+),score=192.29 NODE_6165_length_1699_cov_4.182570:106-1581(+)